MKWRIKKEGWIRGYCIIQALDNDGLEQVGSSGSDKKEPDSEYFQDKASRMKYRLVVRGIKIDSKDCGLSTYKMEFLYVHGDPKELTGAS